MQVSMSAVFEKLKVAHKESYLNQPILEWINENSENINCLYWAKVLELEAHIIIFILSLRECNFQLHLQFYGGRRHYLDKATAHTHAQIYSPNYGHCTRIKEKEKEMAFYWIRT